MLATTSVWVGRMVRAARDLLGWTQARLACEAGISSSTVHRVELGQVSVGSSSIAEIVAALDRQHVHLDASASRVQVVLDFDAPPVGDFPPAA